MKRLFLLLALITAIPMFAQTKTLVNVDRKGFALQGYDPVAFFTQSRPVKGMAQFGGFCAYGASRGHTAPVKIEAWQIVNGRLLMQYDLGVKKDFNKDQQGNLQKADKNWPGIVAKKGH